MLYVKLLSQYVLFTTRKQTNEAIYLHNLLQYNGYKYSCVLNVV